MMEEPDPGWGELTLGGFIWFAAGPANITFVELLELF